MLEEILKYERTPFLELNGSDSVLLDHFMWLISNKYVWIPLIISLIIILFYKKNWKEALLVILCIALVITIADQVCSSIFKPYFHRLRPTHHPDFVNDVKILFGYRGGRYGFASSHAGNAFGVAMFTSLLFRNKIFTICIFCFAFLNGYSRIYLGVHFISDIVAGAIIGILAGLMCYRIYLLGRRYILKVSVEQLYLPVYPQKSSNILSIVFISILLLLLLFNNQLIIFLH